MGQITKVQVPTFQAGEKVVVTNPGNTYSTYRPMAEFLKLEHYVHGRSTLKEGMVVTVLGSAMHESSYYGEVVGVRTETGEDIMVGTSGLKRVELEENGQPVLKGYLRAPLDQSSEVLKAAVAQAPAWALYVGQDDCGIHFFDHHPYVYNEGSLLKGLLPIGTHRVKMSHSYTTGGGPIIAMRIKGKSDSKDATIDQLRRELAEVKAELWEAERKLAKIQEVVA